MEVFSSAQMTYSLSSLVGADDVLSFFEWFAFPPAFVEVQDPSRFLGQLLIAGEDPRAVIEGPDGVFGEPPPDGGSRDRGYDASLHRLPRQFLSTPATQGYSASRRKLTGQRLHLHPHLGGKREAACPSGGDPPLPQALPHKSACATCRPSGSWCRACLRSPCWGCPPRRGGRSWRVPPPHVGRCEPGRAFSGQDGSLFVGGIYAERTLAGHAAKPSLPGRYGVNQKTLPRKGERIKEVQSQTTKGNLEVGRRVSPTGFWEKSAGSQEGLQE
jgi:hypothetical protein